ncbi:hypothetical protein HMN09_01295100 [Mycena chlorophos]|uniref:DUF6534 domain-containing protein n=1 Tax=Mycena chlorophos TaxID=658473 RepID=A0A8H6VSI6_MYCCL|nr:hypothetical protein HMN09_01295100 [Mycena chlorophos]
MLVADENGTPAAPLPAGTPSFELMFAPLLLGVLLNSMLLGVFLVQIRAYFHLFKSDTAWIRYLVYYLIVLEATNTICAVGVIYEPLIKMHDAPLVQVNSPKLLAADPIVTTLISTPVQLFMAWRIWLVTKSIWHAALVGVLAFASLAGGIASTVLVALNPQFEHFASLKVPLAIWLTSTAFADLFITGILVNFLWLNKTGFQTQTDSVTDKIIFFTVQTGMLTSVAAMADVILFLSIPHTTLNFIWDFCLSKLYSVCLVATLNARQEWNTLLFQPLPIADANNSNTTVNAARKGSATSEAIIKIRRATQVEQLQLYIPSLFGGSQVGGRGGGGSNVNGQSPARRRTTSPWSPVSIPLWRTAVASGHGVAEVMPVVPEEIGPLEQVPMPAPAKKPKHPKTRKLSPPPVPALSFAAAQTQTQVQAQPHHLHAQTESARRTAEWARSAGAGRLPR